MGAELCWALVPWLTTIDQLKPFIHINRHLLAFYDYIWDTYPQRLSRRIDTCYANIRRLKNLHWVGIEGNVSMQNWPTNCHLINFTQGLPRVVYCTKAFFGERMRLRHEFKQYVPSIRAIATTQTDWYGNWRTDGLSAHLSHRLLCHCFHRKVEKYFGLYQGHTKGIVRTCSRAAVWIKQISRILLITVLKE